MEEDNKIIYDAETDSIDTENKSDLNPETEQVSDENVIYDAEKDNPVYQPEENPFTNQEESYEIDENQKTVFDNGLVDGQFIRLHNCPMCMVGKKSISELYMRKRFSRKKKVVGYASICANCGFTSFYTTNINDLLLLFRGKINI